MMKSMLAGTAAFLIGATSVPAVEWQIDKAHSSVNFSVRHLVVSKTRGVFKDFDGSITFDGKDLSAGSVSFVVKTASVDTDDQKRDEHLRSPDFMDAEKYPEMTFKSKKVTPGKDGRFMLTGDLTIKGVTKEVTFDCEFFGAVKDPWGNTKAGFSAETKIDRQDFNVTWSKALDGGGLVVGDEVTITLEIEAMPAEG